MAEKKQPFQFRVTGSPTGTTLTLTWTPPRRERTYIIERQTIRDDNHDFTSLEESVQGHGYDQLIFDKHGCIAAYDYWYDRPLSVYPGESLQISFVGLTASDFMTWSLRGVSVDSMDDVEVILG